MGYILGGLSKGLAMGHIQVFTLNKLKETAMHGGRLLSNGYLLPHFLDIYTVVESN